MNRSIADAQWQAILHVLPDGVRRRAINNPQQYRCFIDSVIWIAKTDAFWHEFEPVSGGWRSVYVKFLRWEEKGIWERVCRTLEDDQAIVGPLKERLFLHRLQARRSNKSRMRKR